MTRSVIFVYLFLATLAVAAQAPLVGTWELVSLKGSDADGNPVLFDEFSMREMKIITPTHYMTLSHRVAGDSLAFDKALAGTIKVTGPKFVETPLYTSNPDDMKSKTDFTWKVEGDKFTQSGIITLADGRKVKRDAMVYQRVKSTPVYEKGIANGTWNQLSAGFTMADGKKDYHTKATAIRFMVINPTHFMRINLRDGAFEDANFGTYTIEGGSMAPIFKAASYKLNPDDNSRAYMDMRAEGDVLFLSGTLMSGEGKELLRWEDVFLRVGK